VAAIVLFVGVPMALVLYGFYVRPEFEPYKWREAAQHIERRIQSGDVIAVYPGQTRVALTYYLRGDNWQNRIIGVALSDPQVRFDAYEAALSYGSFTSDRVKQLRWERRRLWLVMTVPAPEGGHKRLVAAVDRYFQATDLRVFGQFVWVFLFEPRARPLLSQ